MKKVWSINYTSTRGLAYVVRLFEDEQEAQSKCDEMNEREPLDTDAHYEVEQWEVE